MEQRNSGYRGTVGTVGTEEQRVQMNRGTVGAEEQRDSGYRGAEGTEEQRVQWIRGTEGTVDQRNSGYTGYTRSSKINRRGSGSDSATFTHISAI